MGEYTGRRRGRAASEPSAQQPEYPPCRGTPYQEGYLPATPMASAVTIRSDMPGPRTATRRPRLRAVPGLRAVPEPRAAPVRQQGYEQQSYAGAPMTTARNTQEYQPLRAGLHTRSPIKQGYQQAGLQAEGPTSKEQYYAERLCRRSTPNSPRATRPLLARRTYAEPYAEPYADDTPSRTPSMIPGAVRRSRTPRAASRAVQATPTTTPTLHLPGAPPRTPLPPLVAPPLRRGGDRGARHRRLRLHQGDSRRRPPAPARRRLGGPGPGRLRLPPHRRPRRAPGARRHRRRPSSSRPTTPRSRSRAASAPASC